MALKIGVISPEQPARSLPVMDTNNGSSWLWFNEIEAALAYLQSDLLDKLYIDRNLIAANYSCIQKHQRLIEQSHPRLTIIAFSFNESACAFHQDPIAHFPSLETIFAKGELKSVFQPIVEWRENNVRLHGIECLSRMMYNGQSYAPEYVFNYAAEKLTLTNYDRTCLMQALSLVPHGNQTLVFINVRPQTLIGEGFDTWFLQILTQHQLVPEQIVIEVTEQYCNISEYEMGEHCKRLKNHGLRLAIDDFGSGISNLCMLEIMRPSYLKISGRFIKNSHQDVTKQKIVKNILALAADFNIIPIVESVELEQEWQHVQKLGATIAQGFLFYKPMSKEELCTSREYLSLSA